MTAAAGGRKHSEEGRGLAAAASSRQLEARGRDFAGSGRPESLICDSVSNTIDKGWLSIVTRARTKLSL